MGKLTTKEAWRNLRETVDAGFKTDEEFEHYLDTVQDLMEAAGPNDILD